MAKRPPFDTHLNFPPAPTRALLSTPLDGIIGGSELRPAPPPPTPPASEVVESRSSARPESPPVETASHDRAPNSATSYPPPTVASTRVVEPLREPSSAIEPGDDGKVTVKLPPELKNRLYNAIYHERGTVGDYLTRAVDDLMDLLERERGGQFPQRPPSDAKFRAGRRAN